MRRNRRGFTLIEVLVATAVLGIGAVATLRLVGLLINSNANMSANTDAMAFASRLAAEIGAARFIEPGNQDPHLALGTYTDPDGSAVRDSSSTIQSWGAYAPGGISRGAARPIFLVSYQVRACPNDVCGNPNPGRDEPQGGGVDIIIEVRNFDTQGPLLKPVYFVLRKEYNAAANGAAVRGF